MSAGEGTVPWSTLLEGLSAAEQTEVARCCTERTYRRGQVIFSVGDPPLDRRCDLFFGLPVDQRFVDDNPRIALSHPYYVMGQALISRTGEGIHQLEDLRGRVVGVQAMTSGDLLMVEKEYARRVYLTPEETFAAVRTRLVDAAVMDSTPAGWLAKQVSGIGITQLREPAGEFKVAVGMRREDRALREAVNRGLQRLREEGKIEEILQRYGVPLQLGSAGAGTR